MENAILDKRFVWNPVSVKKSITFQQKWQPGQSCHMYLAKLLHVYLQCILNVKAVTPSKEVDLLPTEMALHLFV